MRTTVDLTDEAYHVAKAVARERNVSLGKVVSEFILQRAGSPATGSRDFPRSAAGFPTFSSDRKITSEDVRVLLEDDY
ncbi:MAG: hypothetical protein ABI824_01155 [Acidobacteriota bacterium]